MEYGCPFVYTRYWGHRQTRDELVAGGYESPFGLQARAWNLALKDAFETVDRFWLSLAEKVRPLVAAQRERGDKRRAKRILKNNLGQKKQRNQRRRMRQMLECEVNRSLSEFWKARAPQVLAHESLRHLVGKFRSKRLRAYPKNPLYG